MESQNSYPISEQSDRSLVLISSLATGRGEAALKANSKIYPFSISQRIQRPVNTTVAYGQPRSNYKQPVQTANTTANMYLTQLPVKEGFGVRYHLLKQVFLVVVGMILCGIPLAVISTLYAQSRASGSTASGSTASGSNSTTGSISATNLTLPSQCSSYTTNTDSTRNIASGLGANCDNTLATGWYRFMGGAGNYLATSYVSRDTCTTYYGGSYSGSLPSTAGATTYGTLCLNNDGYLCYAPWSGSLIGVTNCSGYYVYYLTAITNCNARYCTTF